MDELKERKSLKELRLIQYSDLANISLPFYKSLAQHHHVDVTKEEQIFFNLTKVHLPHITSFTTDPTPLL